MQHERPPRAENTTPNSIDHATASLEDVQAAELRQILHASATGITRCSRDLRYLSVNPAYAQLVGRPVEQIIGQAIVDVIGTDAFEVIRPYADRVLRGERVEYEAEVPCAGGRSKFIHVVYMPWIEPDGQVGGWVGSVSDITDLKHTATELQEREHRLRLALDASGGGSWTWDARTGRTSWDDRFRKLYGFTPEEPPSADAWPSRVHEEDRPVVLGTLDEILRTPTRNDWENTFRIVHPDGTVAWIESRGQCTRDAEGNVVRLTGLDLDVTERHRTEEREAFLLQLSDTLRPMSDPLAIQETTARLLGEHLRVNRVSYADVDGTDFIIRLSYANGVSPFIGRGPVATFGASMFEAHSRGEPIVVNDVRTDPRLTDSERDNLLANEIAAFAGVMVVKDRQWVAAFGAHNATARNWTKTEIDLIRDTAERVWEAIERARTEEALRQREERLRLALDASEAGIWTFDPQTNQLDWDPVIDAQYGYPPEYPRSFETWFPSVHEEDQPRLLAQLDHVLRSTEVAWNITFRIRKTDGTEAWIYELGRAERGPDGLVTRMYGISLDITERRRAEEALQARRDEERDRTMQLLLETAPLGILSVDAQGTIMTANHALERMFGWASGELIGQSVDQLVPSGLLDRHAAHRAANFATPRSQYIGDDLDLVGKRKDGSTFSVEVSLNHVATADGGRAIAFITDISARKRDQAALHQSHGELKQRTRQLSRLASQLTLAEQTARRQLASTLHDGLQQILFSAAMTLDEVMKTNSRDDQAELLLRARAEIKEAVEAARTLSVNLFPPVLHVGGLPIALSWLARRTREQYGIVVNVTADPEANPAASDVRILLFEAVRELLFNAVKHARVGQVDVKLVLGPADTIHIEVSDDGVGFDPSVTLHDKNQSQAGLGLFSIHERLDSLGGHLDIQSAPGKGSRFTLTLPRTRLPHLATEATEIPTRNTAWQERLIYDSTSPTFLRILIADDHPVARAGLRELIGKSPLLQVVGEASSGVEAITQAAALQPDVIVMDVSMPKMNGIDATREIHRTLRRIRIVGLSTHDDESTERLMRNAGAEAYFTKNEGTDRLLDYLLSLAASSKRVSAD
jgi:PAS domain S-box-containing protein